MRAPPVTVSPALELTDPSAFGATKSQARRTRELVEGVAPVALVDAEGRLNPGAVGFSRRPLCDGVLRGARGRKKRWNHWGVLGPDFFFALTVADLDYAGLAVASFTRLSKNPRGARADRVVERVVVTPFSLKVALPDGAEASVIRFDALGFHVAMVDEGRTTRLTARVTTLRGDSVDADLRAERPAGHDSLNVVVPWSDRCFQLTSKEMALPARGHVRVNGEEFLAREGTYACLDYGRGVWPYRTRWFWATAAGVCDGRTIGMNLGGEWTRGTGMTENGFTRDGRLQKIGEEVIFDRSPAETSRVWRIRDEGAQRVDLLFTPERTRDVKVELGVLGTELHQAIGVFEGTLTSDDGERIAVTGLRGTAEEHRARW